MNLGVLVGHSAVRTAVMGDHSSVRKQPTAAEMAEMKRLVAAAMGQGAIGLGASYSLNHSGWGGVAMPSTISDISEFDALIGAMGGPGRGVVEISSGPINHGFMFWVGVVDKAGTAMNEACEWLRGVFADPRRTAPAHWRV
jgi:hypothetical protein